MASNINTTNIDTAYPVAGQDNDSQGFRDNFFNTNENFEFAKTEIEALQGASGGNYIFDIDQTPDNTMDTWVLTYDHTGAGGDPQEVRLKALPVADETSAGILELATQIEVTAGTNAITAVTPLTLQTKLVAGYEPADATILKGTDIGVNVQAYDATILVDADIGVNVQAYDATPHAARDATFNTQTGTAYTAVLADSDDVITMNNAAANTATIPANASVAYPIGTKLNFMQLGAGATTIAITTDTLNVNATLTLVLNGQYAVATALKVTATTWVLFGNLVAV